MKLIFLDIDGTLIPFGGYMPPDSAIRAIELARKKGNKVFINTGRCRCEVHKELLQIGFDGVICSNSLYIEENNQCLLQKDIPEEGVKKLSEWLLAEEVGFFFEGQQSVKAVKLYFEQMAKKFGEKALSDLKKGFPSIKESDLTYDGVAKINFVTKPGIYEKIKNHFGNEYQINEWSFLGDDKGMGEITLKEARKADGVRFMTERLGVNIEDTYSFGDTRGDISMIKYCGTGVAMGNAEKELKEVADFVADTIENDGLYKAFEKFGLID
ncbi:HAD-superfamily hydrolase, subfamily IIB [Treponema sp. JC4]|uniref:Cof-type HAD-IIB family hydrolase n=1 Tax=Treponema sp. JC4 TaxID=1124982 RepID=UPI00025B0C16|nr:Cof-type HAD-IIB family hydrolase [Treponema sp. JC4]EID85465.1 HAD-superfamily hydrolase, subfamily IIB [Treponema sp. JC4]